MQNTQFTKEEVLRGTIYDYNFQDFAEDCFSFNEIADKDNVRTKQDLRNQLNLIKEELNETIEALENEDYVNVVDGFCDVMVTTLGLGQQLSNLKVDIYGAMQSTAVNNHSKFVYYDDDSDFVIKKSVEKYMNEGVIILVEFNTDYNSFILKDTNNKIRKPYGFVSNNLSKFVPKIKLEG